MSILWWINLLNVLIQIQFIMLTIYLWTFNALIQSNIVRAALFNVILEEGHDMGLGGCEGHRLLDITHYTGWDWLPGVW